MIKETSIKELKGIGEKTEKLFAKIGYFYGRRYDPLLSERL